MQMFRFDASAGRTVDRYDSVGAAYGLVAHSTGELQIGCMHVAPNGIIGWHQASVPQLFLVVQGEGDTCGGDHVHQPIAMGQAAFWQAGEWHETRTAAGLTAIIVEGDQLDPAQFAMPEA